MPFASTAQRSYLAIHNPKVAHEFAEKTPKGAKLPHYAPKKPKGRLETMFGKKG